jgi:uncharacterized protein with ParB-like and HNH nuclease domain
MSKGIFEKSRLATIYIICNLAERVNRETKDSWQAEGHIIKDISGQNSKYYLH